MPRSGAVTGWAALRLHGAGYFDGVAADGRSELPVPLVVPPGTGLASRPGTTVHRERIDPDERTVPYGIPATSPARATFDAARRAGEVRAAVAVLDMALASGLVTRAGFERYLASKAGWTGLRQVRSALELADPRSMSPKETALRMIWVLDAGLPRPRCNWPVARDSGEFIGRPDILCEEVAVVGEFDGAGHRTRSQQRDDLRRDDDFRSVGLEPFRVVGADLDDRRLVLSRIRAAVERAQASPVPRSWRLQVNPRPVA